MLHTCRLAAAGGLLLAAGCGLTTGGAGGVLGVELSALQPSRIHVEAADGLTSKEWGGKQTGRRAHSSEH